MIFYQTQKFGGANDMCFSGLGVLVQLYLTFQGLRRLKVLLRFLCQTFQGLRHLKVLLRFFRQTFQGLRRLKVLRG